MSFDKEIENDWQLFGFDKTYSDKKFDEDKANELLYATFEDGCFDVDSQMEALRYATYFAKKGREEAKEFVVIVLQKSRRGEFEDIIKEAAGTSMYLWFRNYFRIIAKKAFSNPQIPEVEREERIRESLNECWVTVFRDIDHYDPNKGAISTFFSERVLRGTFSDFEAKRTGRSSKQKLRSDSNVAKAIDECETRDIEVTPAFVAMITGESYSAVQDSMARIEGEKNTCSYEILDPNGAGGHMSQSIFKSPEESALKVEAINEAISKLDVLSDTERKFFLLSQGLEIKDNSVLSLEAPLKSYEIATEFNMQSKDVAQIINGAQMKLQGNRRLKDDNLLSGRALVFEEDLKDEDEFLKDIIDIY